MGAWPEVGHNVGGGSGSSKAALIPNPAEFPCPRYKQLLVMVQCSNAINLLA